MAHPSKRRTVLAVLYGVMAVAIAVQSIRVFLDVRDSRRVHYGRFYTVDVAGNIDRPGKYRVPYGTTHFEILKVAGVRLTSDISGFILTQQVEGNQNLSVGTRAEPAGLKPAPVTAKVEFFLGDVSVISKDGQTRAQQEGLKLEPGDRVLTEDKSQVEISLSDFSRLDADNFSEITLDKIASVEEGRKVTQITQKAGIVWYKVVYSGKDEKVTISAGPVTAIVAGSGADFLVEIEQGMVRVNTMDGLLLVERANGEEAVNLIAGQSVAAYTDGRPFQVARLALDISAGERFSQLTKEKTNYLTKFVPVNFLFCGVPGVYYLVSLQYETGQMYVVHIPSELSILQFAQGFNSLDEAFLYGGVVFVSSVLEQIMNTRITNYCVFTRENIMRTAAAMGGVSVEIDKSAAAVLGVPGGHQKLTAEQLVKFMAPSVSGAADAQRRQTDVLKALFKALQSRGIVLTALMADQIIASIETNFTSTDVMNNYSRFMAKSDWAFKERPLPVRQAKVGTTMVIDPDLELIRKLFTESR